MNKRQARRCCSGWGWTEIRWQQRFWQDGWQALPAPPAPTLPKLIPVETSGHGMDGVDLAQTYFHRWKCQENRRRDWLIPLNLDTTHGYAKEQGVNSELAKRQGVTTGRQRHLHSLAPACRARLAQRKDQDDQRAAHVQAYAQRRDELVVQVMDLEAAGQTEEPEYFPVQARHGAPDWEGRQCKVKLGLANLGRWVRDAYFGER